MCGNEEETTLHILVTCSVAKNIWLRFGLGYFYGGSIDFVAWHKLMFSVITREKWLCFLLFAGDCGRAEMR